MEPPSGGWSISPASAALPPATAAQVIPREDDEGVQNLQVPVPFDWMSIIPTQGSGVTIWLLSDGINPATSQGPPNLPITALPPVADMCPVGMRGIIDGIFPYVEGAAGPVTQPRIPGQGVTIVWNLFINGKPDRAYGRITNILAPWQTGMSERMMISLRPGEQLTCSCTPTDPNGLYSFFGIRIKGWFIPIKRERAGARGTR